jgi:hypothetical protein
MSVGTVHFSQRPEGVWRFGIKISNSNLPSKVKQFVALHFQWRFYMARLHAGEKQGITNALFQLLRRHDFGLTEREVAELTQMDRRRLNNYLNELKEKNKAYRDDRTWFAE